ncbi:MAG TPA: hypothetical protein VFE91_06830 [Nitrososphaerales archaeon]|nr:hypothetical protein [Nitrososphaerales archaeon]
MKIKDSGDLIYWTYFMVDWSKVKQEPSDVRCTECGDKMAKAEPAVDSKGRKYDGYVCHKDKKLIWVKAP